MPGQHAIEILSFPEFEREQAAWDDLLVASQHRSPFLSHSFISLWWRHFGSGQEFLALVIREGDKLLAGVPLALRMVNCAGLKLTICEIVGTGPLPTRGMGLADKADLLTCRDNPQAARQLAEASAQLLDRVDLFDLKGYDEDSQVAAELTVAAPLPGKVRVQKRSVSPYLPLTGSWEEYLSSRSGNFRKHLRKYRRGLEQTGDVEITRYRPGDDLNEWIPSVLQINQHSWKAERGTNLLRHPALRSFFINLLRRAGAAGWLELHLLKIAGRAAAYEICFNCSGRLFSYNSAFDNSLSRHSPGTVLTAAVIESAFSRELVEYDMLRGGEGYKSRWSDRMRSEMRMLVPAARWLPRIYTCVGPALKSRLKAQPLVSKSADRLNGWLSRIRYPDR